MLIQWLVGLAFAGFVVAVYGPDLKLTHGTRIYPWLRPVGAYTMVICIGLIGLMVVNQQPSDEAVHLLTAENLKEAGRHAWALALMNFAFNLGPVGLGLVLFALAYWLYRHFILQR